MLKFLKYLQVDGRPANLLCIATIVWLTDFSPELRGRMGLSIEPTSVNIDLGGRGGGAPLGFNIELSGRRGRGREGEVQSRAFFPKVGRNIFHQQ